MDFIDMSAHCAPNVAPQTMAAIVSVESSHNPYAIGVVGGRLVRQPASKAEAVATAQMLEGQGKNFSMGMAQVNRHNLPRYNITYSQAFDACTNLRVGALILQDCYDRALPVSGNPQAALRAAFSCYYSGNFTRGFRPDKAGEVSYVQKIVAASGLAPPPVSVPAIESASLPALRAAQKARTNSVLVSNDPPVSSVDPSDVVAKDPSEPELTDATDAPVSASLAAVPTPPPVKSAAPKERQALVF
jgi:type IV secretion system protein VirB1